MSPIRVLICPLPVNVEKLIVFNSIAASRSFLAEKKLECINITRCYKMESLPIDLIIGET